MTGFEARGIVFPRVALTRAGKESSPGTARDTAEGIKAGNVGRPGVGPTTKTYFTLTVKFDRRANTCKGDRNYT